MKSKFKVGDIIRGKAAGRYNITNKHMTKAVVEDLRSGEMKIKILEHVCSSDIGRVLLVDNSTEYFEKVNVNETIVIYRKDNTMVAIDKVTGEKAVAKCSPDDTFDYKVGAKLAFKRLMGEEEETTYYNGKIIFIEGDDLFKTGHIYEVKDGKIAHPEDDRLLPTYKRFKDFEDVVDYFKNPCDRKGKIGWGFETLKLMEVKE